MPSRLRHSTYMPFPDKAEEAALANMEGLSVPTAKGDPIGATGMEYLLIQKGTGLI